MQASSDTGINASVLGGLASKETFCPQRSRRYVLIAAILASALGFIDGSVLSIAMPVLRANLGASLVEAQWISNAYALTLSALILAGGAAGDRFGLRRAFVAGIALFIAASIACAFAPTAPLLILFRAIQGIGAAVMVPGSLAIIAKAYPKTERGRAIGIWAAASALTTALGPVLGGMVLSSFGAGVWRAIFAINLPLGAIAIWLLLAKVPADSPTQQKGLDLGGAALATLAFGGMAYGLTAMSSEGGNGSVMVNIAAFLIGLAALAVFLLWESRHREPMVDLRLFRIAAFSGANAATFFLYFALSAVLFYLPMLLIAGWGLSTAEAGFIFLPLSAAIALLSGPVGRWSDRTGARLPITLGSFVVGLAFVGLALLAGTDFHGFWSGVFPLAALMGLGMALVVSPLSTAIMTSVDDRDTGAASGINNAVARIAGLMAVAALGAVVGLVYAVAGGPASGVEFGVLPQFVIEPAAEALRASATGRAFQAVAAISAAMCFVAAITAWLTQPARPASPPDEAAAGPATH
ncbi:MFS transporter [Mesorhizobium sp. UC22_110]|uniref:MFS transporter n=1 Tax=unclassified Mesorhizobium TaxID=325217 RepID=UPI00366E0905